MTLTVSQSFGGTTTHNWVMSPDGIDTDALGEY